jgi:hypothetical protein
VCGGVRHAQCARLTDTWYDTQQGDTSVNVHVSDAEYTVLRHLMSFGIPKISGWDVVFEPELARFDAGRAPEDGGFGDVEF